LLTAVEADGEFVGSAGLHLTPGALGPGVGYWIAPWARGHGLAPGMLVACEELARREAYTVLNLDVRSTQERAIQIYEESGYVRWGTLPRYARVAGEYVEGYFYTKNL